MKLFWKHKLVLLFFLLFAQYLQAQTPSGYSWQDIRQVDFGSGANYFTIKGASEGIGGEVQLRLDAADGPEIGHVFFHHTGGYKHFIDYTCELKKTISGSHLVYMNFLDYVDPEVDKPLNVGEFQFTMIENKPVFNRDSLHVYDWVPGLDQSPYYEFRVQKVSDLNSSNLADASNWERPFAWFTRCVEKGSTKPYSAYFSNYAGSWSHTYCNFELDANTPIVVKITRLTKNGAPSGPINKVVPRPERCFDKCEIINGEVYVTLSNPGQVALDIDGQLDSRDAPRNVGFPKWGSVAPYTNEKDGVHAVTIFANPFIDDKPDLSNPTVKKVYPGKPLPKDDGTWTTLYFMPGVHKMSVDANGNDREWRKSDVIDLNSNRNYYIPGDAIVYGNFNSFDDWGGSIENVRLFGHGTISGQKIAHWQDWSSALDGLDHSFLRVFEVHGANNVRVEGITSSDQAEHGIYVYSGDFARYNSIKWVKMISWRVNNDGMVGSGNAHIEDCFIRHQDDAYYVDGAAFKRIVLWTDVNGQPLRGSWISESRKGTYPTALPSVLAHEDIDVIYARGVFGKSSVISGGSSVSKTYADGTYNTGQHVLYRNITVSDSNPVRVLMDFITDSTETRALKGLRFENVNYRSKPAFNDGGVGSEQYHTNLLFGNKKANLQYFVFDNVFISGKQLDLNLMNNPEYFQTAYVKDFTFRLRDTIASTGYILTRTVTNGSIAMNVSATNPGEVTLTAMPKEGYEFNGWMGDMASKENPITIQVNRDMAITANVDVFKYDLKIVSDKGTISLDPAGGSYVPGTVVTVKATGNMGYAFQSWSGDLSGTANEIKILVNGDKNIVAHYQPIETYSLTLDATYGAVVIDPPGGVYNKGEKVTLTAKANIGYIFNEWMGDLSGNQLVKTMTMDGPKKVTARFLYAGAGGSPDVAINCGGAQYNASNNVIYKAATEGGNYSTTSPIAGTVDDVLYQSERFDKSFSYNFPVKNGPYSVTLKFAEIFFGDAGSRIFDVTIEGDKVLRNFDIVVEAGGKNIAVDKTFQVTVLDGELNISFNTVKDNAKISAIYITSLGIPVENYRLTTSTTNGTIAINPKLDAYPAGSLTTVSATPAPGFAFMGWTGDYMSFDNPSKVYMDGNKTVQALFEPIRTYTLAVEAKNGGIDISPEGGVYDQLEKVEIFAAPEDGYKFMGWQGDYTGTANPALVVMNSDKTITANIVATPSFTLDMRAENGTVTVNPAKSTYWEGEKVSLTAIAKEGYRFKGWSGDYSGFGNQASITMDANKTITAEFELIPVYTLATTVTNGTITLNPEGGKYQEGKVVTVSLNVDKGYRFIGWQGDLTGLVNPTTLVMNGNKSVTAKVELIPSFTLSVKATNGKVKIDPQKEGYNEGERVTLSATPDAGCKFDGWSGDLLATQPTTTITMNSNKTIAANFSQIPFYTLTTVVNNGTITLDPAGESYVNGTRVTLKLTVDEGYKFVSWLGDYTGTENPTTVVMDRNKKITAAIVKIPTYSFTVDAINGKVTLDPLKDHYLEGEQVIVTATPDENYLFTGWSGDLLGNDNPTSVVMDGNKAIAALFGFENGVGEVQRKEAIQCYPNPFSHNTTITYRLEKAEQVKLRICNSLGQEIQVLVDGFMQVGNHQSTWKGIDKQGNQLNAGMYIYLLETESGTIYTGKLIKSLGKGQ